MAADDNTKLLNRIAFAGYRGISVSTAQQLAERGIGADEFMQNDIRELAASADLRTDIFDNNRRQEALRLATKELDFIQRSKVRPIFYTDTDYPSRLLNCEDAPAMLYALGDAPLSAEHVLAIVGTRHCTAYGKSFTERLVEDLSKKVDNLLIISGLAYGVDITAHRAALNAGIPTGAILAHGLNSLYPPEHRNDAADIASGNGFLLTEYRSIDKTHRGNFLARNRIVAGLSDAVIIVESDLKGGAMTTARIAAAYQREVLAVPGRVTDAYSRGCNSLISNNQAALIRNADDVIAACCWTARPVEGVQRSLPLDISDEQRHLLYFVDKHPEATVNEIAIAMGMPIQKLQTLLFDMEMSDLIMAIPGNRYSPLIPIDF